MPSKPLVDALIFEQEGFARTPCLLDSPLLDSLTAAFDKRQGAGVRHLIDHSLVRAAVAHPTIAALLGEVMARDYFAYKATLFDKNPEANWLVAWHQDLTIPVHKRIDLEGWSGWSRKQGIDYVQAPTEILSRLVALRINLDDCGDDNGPLSVLSRSHGLGRLKQIEIDSHVDCYRKETITGPRGSGLLMRPMLIHASSKAAATTRRRVLHLEFANFDLPVGLTWHRQVAVAA